jgi:thiol peroxidase
LCARAVIVVDVDNKVTYVQVVQEISHEPDYDSVLEAIR